MLSGEALGGGMLSQMFGHYDRTCAMYGGWRYLNESFWEHLQGAWSHRLRLFAACSGDKLVAGALCVEKGSRLYGRYWGSGVDVPDLHFELCFYAPVQHAIERRLAVFEPGQGGHHKFRRGFEPALCRSAHWFFEPRLDGPVREYLAQEVVEVQDRRLAQLAESPLRVKGQTPS